MARRLTGAARAAQHARVLMDEARTVMATRPPGSPAIVAALLVRAHHHGARH